jgi:hypothetical protein
MNELLIKIRAIFEGKGSAEAAAAIKKVGSEADTAKGKLGEYARAIPGVGGMLGTLAGGAALLAGGFKLAADSIRAFAASEMEMAKLDAALANSGQLTDAYREKLAKLATERSGKTGIDDEKYLGVFTTLTKFGANTGNIDSYTTAVENLAGFMGGDMEQAAFLFGKAMTGSTEMLGRYGIHVDKSKTDTEQLADIMRQLQARGGGQLEAMANTLEGSFAKVKNSWENLLESFGSAADKAGLPGYFNELAQSLQRIADNIGGGTAAKSKNREELVGSTPAEQQQADLITAQRKSLTDSKRLKQKESGEAFQDLDKSKGWPSWLLDKPTKDRNAKSQATVDANDGAISHIDAQLAALDEQEKNLKLRRVAPGERAKLDSDRAYQDSFEPVIQALDDPTGDKEREQRRLATKEKSAKEKAGSQEADLLEAKAAGDTKKVGQIEWMKKFQSQIDSGATEWDAKRIANADFAKPGKEASVGVSSMARLGMAVGESSGASSVVDRLSELLKAQQATQPLLKQTADNTKRIADKRDGYQ